MSVRNELVNSLIEHIISSTSMRGFRGLRYLHEINDFPSFYIHVRQENRVHISGGVKLCMINCDLKIYAYSDSIDEIEQLLRAVEASIDSFDSDCLSDDVRVLTVKTDEGLAIPYLTGDIVFQILYRINK